ncbi:TPA: tyrosine-type recombinase/integrase [Enterococcus faecalis]
MAKIEKYIKKNGDKAYKFRIFLGLDYKGKQKYIKKSGFSTKKQALEKLAEIEGKIESEQKYIQVSFHDMYKDWLIDYKDSVRLVTYNRTIDLFRIKILPFFGKKYVDEITTEYCQQILNRWAKEYYKYKALKGYTQQILDLAIKKNLIQKNPMKLCTMPKINKSLLSVANTVELTSSNTENYYDKNELNIFLNTVKQNYDFMWFTAFRLLAFTGMRKGELMALRWSDIRSDSVIVNKSMTMIKRISYVSDTKNEKSNRVISIDPTTHSILMSWKEKQQTRYAEVKDNHLVFTRDIPLKKERDQPFDPDYLNRCMKTVAKENKEIREITIHGFRHTHCSLLFEAGATLKEVQDRLGHANSDITLKIYTHVTTEAKRETANKLALYLDS